MFLFGLRVIKNKFPSYLTSCWTWNLSVCKTLLASGSLHMVLLGGCEYLDPPDVIWDWRSRLHGTLKAFVIYFYGPRFQLQTSSGSITASCTIWLEASLPLLSFCSFEHICTEKFPQLANTSTSTCKYYMNHVEEAILDILTKDPSLEWTSYNYWLGTTHPL